MCQVLLSYSSPCDTRNSVGNSEMPRAVTVFYVCVDGRLWQDWTRLRGRHCTSMRHLRLAQTAPCGNSPLTALHPRFLERRILPLQSEMRRSPGLSIGGSWRGIR